MVLEAQRATVTIHAVVPFLRVSDIVRSSRLYIEGLGFEFADKWEPDGKLTWCRLRHGGAAVMMQEDGTLDAASKKRGEGVSFHFACDDSVAFYQQIRRRGVKACKPMVGNGLKYTIVTDSDGYKLFFESPSNEPESENEHEQFE